MSFSYPSTLNSVSLLSSVQALCFCHFLFLLLLFSFTLSLLAFLLQNQYPAVKCSEPLGGGCCCWRRWKLGVLQGSSTDTESRTVSGLDLLPLSLFPLQEGSISGWGVKFQLAGASRSFGPAEWWSMLALLGAFQAEKNRSWDLPTINNSITFRHTGVWWCVNLS